MPSAVGVRMRAFPSRPAPVVVSLLALCVGVWGGARGQPVSLEDLVHLPVQDLERIVNDRSLVAPESVAQWMARLSGKDQEFETAGGEDVTGAAVLASALNLLVGRQLYCIWAATSPDDRVKSVRKTLPTLRWVLRLGCGKDTKLEGKAIRLTSQWFTKNWGESAGFPTADRIPKEDGQAEVPPGWPAVQRAVIHELAHTPGLKNHGKEWQETEAKLWDLWKSCRERLADFGDADPARHPSHLLSEPQVLKGRVARGTVVKPDPNCRNAPVDLKVDWWRSPDDLGAHHLDTRRVWFGTAVDRETDPVADDGDDGIRGGSVKTGRLRLAVSKNGPDGQDRIVVHAWVDRDNNGSWQEKGEHLVWTAVSGPGAALGIDWARDKRDPHGVIIDPSAWNESTENFDLCFDPIPVPPGKAWMRLRVYRFKAVGDRGKLQTRESGKLVKSVDFQPYGPADQGEVEDYEIQADGSLASGPPAARDAALALDPTSRMVVCLKPGQDASAFAREFDLADARTVAIPAGAEWGGGRLVSYRMASPDSESGRSEWRSDPRVCFQEKDHCRIYLPQPASTTAAFAPRAESEPLYILKGGTVNAQGEPLAGVTLALDEAPPSPEEFVAGNREPWREERDSPPPPVTTSDSRGGFEIPVGAGKTQILYGVGWESGVYEIQHETPCDCFDPVTKKEDPPSFAFAPFVVEHWENLHERYREEVRKLRKEGKNKEADGKAARTPPRTEKEYEEKIAEALAKGEDFSFAIVQGGAMALASGAAVFGNASAFSNQFGKGENLATIGEDGSRLMTKRVGGESVLTLSCGSRTCDALGAVATFIALEGASEVINISEAAASDQQFASLKRLLENLPVPPLFPGLESIRRAVLDLVDLAADVKTRVVARIEVSSEEFGVHESTSLAAEARLAKTAVPEVFDRTSSVGTRQDETGGPIHDADVEFDRGISNVSPSKITFRSAVEASAGASGTGAASAQINSVWGVAYVFACSDREAGAYCMGVRHNIVANTELGRKLDAAMGRVDLKVKQVEAPTTREEAEELSKTLQRWLREEVGPIFR